MAQYLTQSEYVAMGGDPAMGALMYDRREFRARKAIDGPTFGRVKEDSPQREAVKMLVFELVTMFATNDKLRQQETEGNVSSWSNDGVSVSVKQATSLSENDLDAQAAALVCEFLGDEVSVHGTPLLYRGASICP